MSNVTNLIIITSSIDEPDYVITALKKFSFNGNQFIIKSVEDASLPKGWYGGGKYLECNIFIGAYNYLPLNELLSFMQKEIKWEFIEGVQILAKEENDIKFRMFELSAIEIN